MNENDKKLLPKLNGGIAHPILKPREGIIKTETVPDAKTMEAYNIAAAAERKVVSGVEAAVKQHTVVRSYVEGARKYWCQCMEEFLKSHVVGVFGDDAVEETTIKYQLPQQFTFGSLVQDADGFKGMMCEALVEVRGVDLWRVLFYAKANTVHFEVIPLGALEEEVTN